MLTVFETKSVFIRYLNNLDFADITLMMSEPELVEYLGESPTADQIIRWIEQQQEFYYDTGLGFFTVLDKESGNFIGLVGVTPTKINGDKVAMLQYFIKEERFSQQYIVEATSILMDHVFEQYGFSGAILHTPFIRAAEMDKAKDLPMHPKVLVLRQRDNTYRAQTIFLSSKEEFLARSEV